MSLDFWTSTQGNAYVQRNPVNVPARIQLWREILFHFGWSQEWPRSIIELGAGTGQNLSALHHLCPRAELHASEPNGEARKTLSAAGLPVEIISAPAHQTQWPSSYAELAFTSGVLIHVPPQLLGATCKEIYRLSSKYIVSVEYFSDKPEMIRYHGEDDRLWKRDFGQYWLDHFNVRPLGCGFAWRAMTGLDNLTWWAFQKCN